MKHLLLFVFVFVYALPLYAQPTDHKLAKKVAALIEGFNGDISVYVKNLHTGKVVAINADTVFPTASIIKIPIAIGVLDKINRGELSYHQELVYHDSLLYEGVDILGSFKSGEKIELSKVFMLMLTMSDNTASLWLQQLAGTGTRINQLMEELGLKHVRVNSRTRNRENARSRYGWGQMTTQEMALLLEKIYRRQVVSPAASDRLLRSLNRNYWDAVSLAQIPPYATIFSKNGAVDESRSEVALVKGNKAHYVFCVATKNNKDHSWDNTNEAWTLTRKIAALLWNYFEPKDNWQPGAEAEKFY